MCARLSAPATVFGRMQPNLPCAVTNRTHSQWQVVSPFQTCPLFPLMPGGTPDSMWRLLQQPLYVWPAGSATVSVTSFRSCCLWLRLT
jgi:hypothetical protein